MRTSSPRLPNHGFTLIELLVVIGIIGILAAIVLPVLSIVKTRTRIASARREMQGLTVSIGLYQGDYNRYPVSRAVESAAAKTDFTYGTAGLLLSAGGTPVLTGLGYDTNNSEAVMILMAIDGGANSKHARNTRRTRYWDAKMVSSPVAGVSTEDYIARDPWGSPYMVTMDMNDDNKCFDPLYRKASVSERQTGDNTGFYGLSRRQPGDNFEVNGSVIIWSAGPDASFAGNQKANAGVNRDNVLSWSN